MFDNKIPQKGCKLFEDFLEIWNKYDSIENMNGKSQFFIVFCNKYYTYSISILAETKNCILVFYQYRR